MSGPPDPTISEIGWLLGGHCNLAAAGRLTCQVVREEEVDSFVANTAAAA